MLVLDFLHRNNLDANIKVREHDNIHLQTNTRNIDISNALLNLTWYHNGSVISPRNRRYTFSDRNKTLTITNFTSAYAGIYHAQFNQLFVHPFDEVCREDVLSLLRNHPMLNPVAFCINMEESCSDELLGSQVRQILVSSLGSDLQGTLKNIKLKASGTVLSSKELQYSIMIWYRNGLPVTSSLSNLQRNYNNLRISQELQVSDVTYEHSGRYEVVLVINMRSYLYDSTACKPYYDRFVLPYLTSSDVPLAKGYVDIGYYKGDFTLNK